MLRRLNARGTTLFEALVAIAITAAVAVLVTPIVNNMTSGVRLAEKKQEVLELTLGLQRWLRDPACICHLDRDQNTARSAALTVNTTTPTSPDIDLGVIRETCDLSATDNLIAEAGRQMPRSLSRLQIAGVTIRNIRRINAAGLYSAQLNVTFAADGEMALRAPSIPMVFNVDLAVGTPASRKIKNCGIEMAKRITSCPPGMELIGPPGAIGTFCVERNSRPPPATFSDASNSCYALPPNPLGSFRVCQVEALTVACASGRVPSLNGTQWELFDNGWDSDDPNDNHAHAVGSGCASYGNRKGYGPYRCCLM